MVSESSIVQPPFLRIEKLVLTYAGMKKPALEIPELQIGPGECVVLCGVSGSGKSSVLRLLNGLVPDYYPAQIEGEVFLKGHRLLDWSLEAISAHVASVFQHPASQFFHPTVLQELVFACENQGLPLATIDQRLKRVLATFPLEHLLDTQVLQLSGGQQQQLALASAVMQGTDVILLDEPTANLDHDSVLALQALLQELKNEGKTLLIAEHHLAYLSELADRYLYFEDGKLCIDYPATQFLQRTEICRQEMGLRCYDLGPYRKEVAVLENAFTDDSFGLAIQQLAIRQGSQLLYEIDYLCLSFGQVVGLTGVNGSGKSSLAVYLAGLKDDPKATISWKGKPLSAKQRLMKTAFVMQEVSLQLFTESVRKELLLANPQAKLDPSLLHCLKLETLLERHPASLSGGEQQRLLLAANLLQDNEIFIFDEPTSGLDLRHMQEVAHLLRTLKLKGKLVLLISHDEELLTQVADKVIALPFGKMRRKQV